MKKIEQVQDYKIVYIYNTINIYMNAKWQFSQKALQRNGSPNVNYRISTITGNPQNNEDI